MVWNAARHWPKGAGLLLATLCAAGLLSFDLNDPTLTNLRLHSSGTGNWLSLPGALVFGSLVELFGAAALLLPLLILNWCFGTSGRPPAHRYGLWSISLVAALSAFHGLLSPVGEPGWLGPGLAGWAGNYWSAVTTGPWLAGAMLAFLAAYAANRVLFTPVFRRLVRGSRAVVHHATGRSLRMLAATRRGIRAALAPPQHRLTPWTLGGALVDALAVWRRPSLAAIKSKSLAAASEPAFAGAEWEPRPPLFSPPASDGFDSWLASGAAPGSASPEEGTVEGDPARREQGVSPGPPGAPESNPLPGGGDEFQAALQQQLEPPAAPSSPGDPPPPERPELPPEPGSTTPSPGGPAGGRIGGGMDDPGSFLPESPLHAFDQPEAEAAWRERFQRYARNLDLDWEDQMWAKGEATDEDEESNPHDPPEG